MISYDEALNVILANSNTLPHIELIDLANAKGRILAEDILADRNYPPFNRSQMDGFALASEHYTKGRQYALQQRIFAGEKPIPLTNVTSNCSQIMTGAAIPPHADSVVKIEDAYIQGDTVEFRQDQISIGQFVSRAGEDARVGQVVARAGSVINEANCIALASVGAAKVSVYKKVNVSIISTGDEVVDIADTPGEWQIRNANQLSLIFHLQNFPVNIALKKHVPDKEKELSLVIQDALAADLVILSGGVSQGETDHVPALLKSAGVDVIFHKCAVKPGKPILMGKKQHTLVFGLPGNPVSSSLGFLVFVAPALRQLCGMRPERAMRLPVEAPRQKRHSLTEFVPCRITAGENQMSMVTLLSMKSSGDIMALNGADGIAVHEAHKQELKKGELVSFYKL